MLLFSLLLLPLISRAIALGSDSTKPTAFEFLNNLKGCHRGDKVKGIHDLKKYLEKFGYLNYPPSKNQTHVNDNEFDDLLETAVKTYQLNYHLKATGSLDESTVTDMMAPRCGVADIINGTNSMRSGKEKRQHRPSSFHTVSHYAFFPGSPRWPPSKTHLTYGFLPGTPAEAVGPVTRAFAKWDSATHFTFARTQDHRRADMTIGFHRREHGDGAPFDGPGGTIAHAFSPTNGRLHYDADESWAVGANPGSFDLETVALHEIGHLLGLGHSSVREAIMFSHISTGVTKGLHGDDIQGIKALYNV